MMRVFLLSLLLCCSAGSFGTVLVRPSYQAGEPARFSVQPGHVIGKRLDVRLEGDCLRGTLGGAPLVLCSERAEGGGERWAGPSGNFTVERQGADAIRVLGYLTPQAGREVHLNSTLQLGHAPEWEELRRQPALLVMATLAADLGP